MSIHYAILGFLSRSSLTGYELKKLFADSDILYWSGNNNQIYRALVELHDQGFVTREIHDQETGPSRKVYTITGLGLAELRQWMQSTPELPQVKNPFLIQLAWADLLDAGELDAVLAAYEEELSVKLLMLQEQAQRAAQESAQTPRAARLWDAITQHSTDFFAHELDWVRALRSDLSAL